MANRSIDLGNVKGPKGDKGLSGSAATNSELAFLKSVANNINQGRYINEYFSDTIDSSYQGNVFQFIASEGHKLLSPRDSFRVYLKNGRYMIYELASMFMSKHRGYASVDASTEYNTVMLFSPVSMVCDSSGNRIEVPWSSKGNNNGTSSVRCPYLCSDLHNWEENVFYETMLPDDLKEVISPSNEFLELEIRYSDSGTLTDSTGSDIRYSNMYDPIHVFSPSESELFGMCVNSSPHGNYTEKFKSISNTPTWDRYIQASGSNYNSWYPTWTRNVSNKDGVSAVYFTRGGSGTCLASYNRTVFPCFCIGPKSLR